MKPAEGFISFINRHAAVKPSFLPVETGLSFLPQ